MTYRQASDAIRRYLRTEQRVTPHADESYDNPLPDVIQAMNAALQQISVLGPFEATKQGRAAYFRAPATVAVSALTRGGTTCTITGAQSYMAGCQIALPGDPDRNRIIKLSGTTATLQFPHISDSTSGDAVIYFDTAELPTDIITVHEPVKKRGTGAQLEAVLSRQKFEEQSSSLRYYIEATTATPGIPRYRMMLSSAPTSELVIEFQARCALGRVAEADIQGAGPGYADPGVEVQVPAGFAESIFLPIATDLFFAAPSIVNYDIAALKNADAVKLIRDQAAAARVMLSSMKPQGKKPMKLMPWS
jgi:hypothetical protein